MARSKKPLANSETATASDDEEAVGYCKPPKEHQFKPGQSGNPNGRPKKKGPTARELMAEFASETIPIKRGGRVENVPRFRAFQEKLFQLAMNDNTAAGNMFIKLLGMSGQLAPPEPQDLTETKFIYFGLPEPCNSDEEWEALPNEQVVDEGEWLRSQNLNG